MKQPTVTIEAKSKEDDNNIFYKGNIVVNTNGKIIVLVTGEEWNNVFAGATLLRSDDIPHHYSTTWNADAFKQFMGRITIEV